LDDIRPGLAYEIPKDERCDDGVVERSRDRDELRDEVDRRSDPDDCSDYEDLGPSGNAVVVKKRSEEVK
jgi:hypothetical protein